MTFKTLTRAAAALVLVLLSFAVPVAAQTALSETTIAVAVSSTSQRVISVASATGISVGVGLYVDREYMTVTAVSGTNISVIRGVNGVNSTHAAGVLVYAGPAIAFRQSDPAGSCTATAERYLPQINPGNGAIWDCPSAVGKWVNLRNRIAVTCRALLVADQIDQSCFIADRQYLLVKIQEIHTTAESAGTLTLILRRQQGTEAPASGDALTASAVDMVGAGAVAQTLKTPTLTATASLLILEAGNRLGLDYTDDVAGELAGVVVTFWLIPL